MLIDRGVSRGTRSAFWERQRNPSTKEVPMSTKSHDELPSIDPTQLSAVTGGVTTDTSSSDTLTTMMQQMMSSLQDLTQNQGGSSMNEFMEMLPIMMMMRGQSAAAAPVVEYPSEIPPIGNGSGWTLIP
ncbi:MAG TPA: hypothetical protein VHZ95_05630 [Polyangiales bacterium]|nr:hypothetical protein [Polyangiales bacterium]